jgi:hypothetical protein
MPRYFTYLHSANAPSNKLEAAVKQLLANKSNILVSIPADFLKQLQIEIEELNKSFPRCSPLALHSWEAGWSRTGPNIGISLGGKFTVGFYLYPIDEAGEAA